MDFNLQVYLGYRSELQDYLEPLSDPLFPNKKERVERRLEIELSGRALA